MLKRKILKQSLVFSFLCFVNSTCFSQLFLTDTLDGVIHLKYFDFDSCYFEGDNFILIIENVNGNFQNKKAIPESVLSEHQIFCDNIEERVLKSDSFFQINMYKDQTIEFLPKKSDFGSYCFVLIRVNSSNLLLAFPSSNFYTARSILKKTNKLIFNLLNEVEG